MSRSFVACFMLHLLLSPFGALATDLADDLPVDLSAAELEYERETETWRARGDVRLQKGDFTLMADRVWFNTATSDAAAIGRVQLSDRQAVVVGEDLHLNTETGRGVLRRGEIEVREQNYHIAGEEIERLGETSYRILDGTFTTCEGEPPAWKFSARRLDVTLGGWARARHVLFYIRDIPLLYFPFFAYPVKTERESGFLAPRIGSSNRRGFQLSLAWYQVIDRNQDATFYLDYLSRMGIGKGLEYRYIFAGDNAGVLNAYHINGLQDNDTRYALDWRHSGELPGKLRLTADIEHVSSRDYYEDFGIAAEEYSKEEAQSVLAVNRLWRRSSLTGQFKYTKDLETDNDATLQKLPEIVFNVVPTRLADSPFFFAMEASSTYFWRREGIKGERLTVRPELSAVFQPGDFLEIQPVLGYRERLYWTSDEGPGFERDGIADFTTRLSTRFSRIYTLDGATIGKIRHSVEPEITYRYVPPENQGHLPQFDVLDEIGPENRVSYGLVNRLTARLQGEGGHPVYHELLYLRLSQEFDIRESRRDPSEAENKERPFSELRTELVLRPNFWSYLDLDFRYDVNSGADRFFDRFPVVNTRAGIFDQQGNALGLDYYFQRIDEVSYLSGSVDLAWFRPLHLNYLHRHDLDSGTVLEKVLNLEYRSQCWSLLLTLRDRPDETEYLIGFQLAGLGKVAELGGNLGGE